MQDKVLVGGGDGGRMGRMRWHCRDRDRAKDFFLILQQRLHQLLHPGDPVLTGTAPGLPTAWEPCLPAPLQGNVGIRS